MGTIRVPPQDLKWVLDIPSGLGVRNCLMGPATWYQETAERGTRGLVTCFLSASISPSSKLGVPSPSSLCQPPSLGMCQGWGGAELIPLGPCLRCASMEPPSSLPGTAQLPRLGLCGTIQFPWVGVPLDSLLNFLVVSGFPWCRAGHPTMSVFLVPGTNSCL